jgi:hypothetical protein
MLEKFVKHLIRSSIFHSMVRVVRAIFLKFFGSFL